MEGGGGRGPPSISSRLALLSDDNDRKGSRLDQNSIESYFLPLTNPQGLVKEEGTEYREVVNHQLTPGWDLE